MTLVDDPNVTVNDTPLDGDVLVDDPAVLVDDPNVTVNGTPLDGAFTWRAVIGGVDYDVEPDSVRLEKRVNERTAPAFTLWTDDGVHFDRGQTVELWHETVRLFAGMLWDVDEEYWSPDSGLIHQLTAVDWHILADRRNIARGYESGTRLGDVVRDIIDLLAPDGVTEGDVDDGPVLAGDSGFNYVPCTQALDALAEQAGFWWQIDDDRKVDFLPFTARTSPWNIAPAADGTLEDVDARTLRVGQSAPDYRNRQFLRGVRVETDPQTERFTGDSETRTYTCGFLLARVPTVTVDGAPQTVGIRGLDTGRDWYWAKGDRTITQDAGDTPLTSSQVLQVVYIGIFDSVILSSDLDAIGDRVDVEGFGTGTWDHVAEVADVDSRQAGFSLAAAKLREYATVGRRITYRTERAGIAPGQLQTITAPRHGLSGLEVLVEAVSVERDGQRLRYTVDAIAGPLEHSWTRFFGEIARQPKLLVVRENLAEDEVLTRLFSYSKTWAEADRPNIFLEPLADGTWLADGSVTPAFRPDDRLRYVEVYAGSTLLIRKILTQRTGLDTDQINTVGYIAPQEAIGSVTEIAWVGGFRATSHPGTGVEVAREGEVEDKTSTEAWQLDREDAKWTA